MSGGIHGPTGPGQSGIDQSQAAINAAKAKRAQDAINARYQAAADFYAAQKAAASGTIKAIHPDAYRSNPSLITSVYTQQTAQTLAAVGMPSKVDRGYIISNARMVPVQGAYTFKESGKLYAWKFNFLYNPAAVGTATSVNWDIPPVQSILADKVPVISPTGATLQFDIFLNRIDDNAQHWSKISNTVPAWPGASQSKGTAKKPHTPQSLRWLYQQYGTLADLEFLYRVINGNPVGTVSRGITADWGHLFPVIVDVVLSPNAQALKYTGYISDLSVNHVMFNPQMVPILSQVTVTLTRLMDIEDATGKFSWNYNQNSSTTSNASTSSTGG